MKAMTVGLLLVILAPAAHAAVKDCGELKNEIAEKLKAKNVATFSLEVVAADAVADRTVVGSCEGGTKKIIYSKNPDRSAM
jgi:hypothetical protein